VAVKVVRSRPPALGPRFTVLVFDGPPACGKTTLVRLLKRRYDARAYRYTRLRLVNILFAVLAKISPNLLCSKVRRDNVDPVMLVNSYYLEKVSWLIFVLEVVYKYLRYSSLLSLALCGSLLVVDEGFSLGWANYLNLMLHRKALKPGHVDLLMRLDLQFLKLLTKVRRVYIYFIDRSLEKLSTFWRNRGHRVHYDTTYALLVRYSFRILEEACRRFMIAVRIKRVYVP